MASRPRASARRAVATKAALTRSRPARSSSSGAASPSFCGMAEGANGRQPPFSGEISWPPSQGSWLDALRPAWAICMAIFALVYVRIAAMTGRRAASVRSSHRPRSAGVMRPSGSTAVASMITRPAPDMAIDPKCIICQSVAAPLSAEYWHIGATTTRLGRLRLRMSMGEKRALICDLETCRRHMALARMRIKRDILPMAAIILPCAVRSGGLPGL